MITILAAPGKLSLRSGPFASGIEQYLKSCTDDAVIYTPSEHLLRQLRTRGLKAESAYPSSWHLSAAATIAATADLGRRLRKLATPRDLSPAELKFVTNAHIKREVAALIVSSQQSVHHIFNKIQGNQLRILMPAGDHELFGLFSDTWLYSFLLQVPQPDQLLFTALSLDGRWRATTGNIKYKIAKQLALTPGEHPPPREKHQILYAPAAAASSDLVRGLLCDAYTVETAYACLSDPADEILGASNTAITSVKFDIMGLPKIAQRPPVENYVCDTYWKLMREALDSIQATAHEIVRTVDPSILITSDCILPDSALLVVEMRRAGKKVALLPHATAPIDTEIWKDYLPDIAVATWRVGANKWREIGVSDYRVNSQLKQLEPHNPIRRPKIKPTQLRILYVGSAGSELDFPAVARDTYEANRRALLLVPSDLTNKVCLSVKPRPVWEDPTWYKEFANLQLTDLMPVFAASTVDIAVCHDVLTTGLYEAIIGGAATFFVTNDELDEHVPRSRSALPSLSVDEFWDTVRAAISELNVLNQIRAKQRTWLREQTAFDPLPTPGWSRRKELSLFLRRSDRTLRRKVYQLRH